MQYRTDFTEPILGWLLEPNTMESTVSVMLRDTGNSIELSVPFKNQFYEKHGLWFMQGLSCVVDGKRVEPEPPPTVLQVIRNNEWFLLLGCRVVGSSSSIGGPGTGILRSSYLISGARNPRYTKVNGMRSKIQGLLQWTGLESLKNSLIIDKNNRFQQWFIIYSKWDRVTSR